MSLSIKSIETGSMIREPGEKRIAIVGASNNLFKVGTIQCLNLINSGFSGDILPVHPREKVVLGKKAYPPSGICHLCLTWPCRLFPPGLYLKCWSAKGGRCPVCNVSRPTLLTRQGIRYPFLFVRYAPLITITAPDVRDQSGFSPSIK